MDKSNGLATTFRTCQWTGGTSEERQTCNHAVVKGKSYCRKHYAITYENITDDSVDTYIEETLTDINTE